MAPKRKVFSPELIVAIEAWKVMPHAKLAQVAEGLYQLATDHANPDEVKQAAEAIRERSQAKIASAEGMDGAGLASMLAGDGESPGDAASVASGAGKGRGRGKG